MSDHAGFICSATACALRSKARARSTRASAAKGVARAAPTEAARAVQWRQMALASEAVLTALDAYIGAGGGSRGARVTVRSSRLGDAADTARAARATIASVPERKEDRGRQIVVRRDGDGFACATRPIRRRDRAAKAYFERDWGTFLSGAVFRDE